MRSRHPLLLGLVLASLHGVARADVTIAEFPATGQFTFDVRYMTDLDQKRAALPGDGSMYCVPTAAMNLFSYAANFGFPEVIPGPGLWEGVDGHDTMTNAISFMGQFMGTDAASGTGGSGYENGMETWIQESGVPLSFVRVARSETAWPTVDTAAFLAAAGAVVNVSYGRYEWFAGAAGVPYLTERKGGHAVTLTRAIAENGSYIGAREVRVRNPGSPNDGDLDSNSQFTSQYLETAANIDVRYDFDDDGTYEPFVVTSLVNPAPTDGRLRILDTVNALYPPGGMSYTHVEVQPLFSGGTGFLTQQPAAIQVALGSTIEAVAVHPEQHSALAIVSDARGRKQLMQFPTGAERPVSLLDLPATSRQLVVGAETDVFVVGQTEIVRLAVNTWSARRVSRTALPSLVAGAPVAAAAFDRRTGALLLVANGRLIVLDPGSHAVRAVLHVGSQAVRSLVVLPDAARRFIVATADGTLIEGTYPATGCTQGCVAAFERRRIDGLTDLAALDVDDLGRLYASDRRAGLIELERDSAGRFRRAVRAWHTTEQSPQQRFVALRSHSSVRPELLDGPEWHNIDPSELLPLGPETADR